MSITPTKQSNPCEVCDDTSGKCRQGKQDPTYFQCMTYADTAKGVIENGFKCIGQIKNGLWAAFKPDNSQEWTEQQRLEWKRQNQQRQKQKAKENERRRRQSLSAIERDRGYRQLLAELTLHPDDRADLVRRGFTDAQIELSGFVSVKAYQRLQGRYSELLPGIVSGKVITTNDGYLCPVRNSEGLIVACQVRLRRLPEGDKNRYRWLSTKEQTLQIDGELPLAVFQSGVFSEVIALVEGTGSKPFLASQRLGLTTIGAAGGLFTSSQEALKAAIGDAKSLLIFPDAGDVANPSVMLRWKNLVDLLEKWEIEVKFGWWGQVDKTHPDVDELEDLSTIQYLTVNEFLELSCPKTLRKSESKNKPSTKIIERGKAFGQKLLGFSQQIDFSKNSQIDCENTQNSHSVPILKKSDGFQMQSKVSQNQVNYKITTSNSLVTSESVASISPDWKNKKWEEWRNWRKLTADTQICSKYVEAKLPQENVIVAIKSGTGTGKTTLLKKWVSEWRQKDSNVSFLCPGYRNSLLKQLAEILSIQHIHEEDIRIMSKEPGSGVAFCIQSFIKMAGLVDGFFAGKIVFLDEIMSTLRDLLTSKTVKKRTKVIELFKRMIRDARIIILMDANLADWGVNLIKSFAPEKEVITLENTYKGDKGQLNFLLGTFTEEIDKIKKNDRSPYLELCINSTRPLISSDSQIFLEALDRILSEMGKKTVRVDSKTLSDPIVKDFLKNSNDCILEYKPEVLLYSPTAESGLDISTKGYFSHHFGFFFGVQGVDAIIQMMGRLRDASCKKYVWIREHGNIGENAVTKSFKDLILDDTSSSLSDEEALQNIHQKLHQLIDGSGGIEFDTVLSINKMSIFEKANLRTCTKEAFIDAGYEVTEYTLKSFENRSEQEKNVKEEVKVEVSELIFKAEQIPIDGENDWKELETLKMSEKPEDRWKVENAFLRKRLPGIETTEAWTPELIYLTKFKDRNFISHAELFWLLQNPNIAKRQSANKLSEMSQEESIFLPDYQNNWSKVNAMKQMGIDKFLSEDAEWHENSPELKVLVKLSSRYENALSVRLTQQKGRNIKYLGKLLEKLGITLKSTKRRVNGKLLRFYQIDPELTMNSLRQTILDCISSKWLDTEEEKIEAEIVQNSLFDLSSQKQPQTYMEHGVEGEALNANNVYKPGIQCLSELEEKASELEGDLGCSNVAIDLPLVSEVEQLVEAFEFCDTVEVFSSVIEDEPDDVIEDAIAASNSLPLRSKLRGFYEALRGAIAYPWGNQSSSGFSFG